MKLPSACALAALAAIMLGCDKDDGDGNPGVTLEEHYTDPFVLQGGTQYLLTRDALFEDSLLIEAGAQILVKGEYRLTTYGPVVVAGTAGSHVKINASQAGSVGFAGFHMQGRTITIDYLDVTGPGQGLVLQAAAAQVSHVTFTGCDVGLWSSNGTLEVSGLEATGCGQGLRAEQCPVDATGLVLVNCEAGVTFTNTAGTLTASTFDNCGSGVASNSGDRVELRGLDIRNCDYGVYYFYGRVFIDQCTIDQNNFGIFMKAYPRWEVAITQSNITDNLTWNLAIDNVPYNNPHHLDISGNWWGTTDVEQITALIQDGWDLAAADTLDIEPVATSPWPH